MPNITSFKVVNASAGSGKTYTLVKAYLKILLNSKDAGYFKNILAVTFTNKAATEMKVRIIERLSSFIEESDQEDHMLQSLVEELDVDHAILKERAQKILHAILQNYSAFNISTLDSFTYRLVRSFAFDLGLSLNFDVEMDAIGLINEAVDELISKIGVDPSITQLLIDFSLQKANDDKSWDISKELKEIAKLLLKENDARHLAEIQDRPIRDFLKLISSLRKKQRQLKESLIFIGQQGTELIAAHQIDPKSFYYQQFPKFFINLVQQLDKVTFEAGKGLAKSITNDQFYTNNKPDEVKEEIDNIKQDLIDLYLQAERIYRQYSLQQMLLKHLIPLAALSKIKFTLEAIKQDRNVYLNAEFNSMVSKNLQAQPAAYIYERLGDKFKHFFVDEMQDTSVLQWQNLIPLIHNALSEEGNSLMLVGDIKQSIYRWRGSEPGQFLRLAEKGTKRDNNPFFLDKELDLLETNYRSYSEIIDFNNCFFQHLSEHFKTAQYAEIYNNQNKQFSTDKIGGYVELSFIQQGLIGEDKDIAYAEKVLQIIEKSKPQFELGEICILVRKRKQGIALANYLSTHEIDVVSSETLLIQNSVKVLFAIDLLTFLNNPKDQNALFDALYFLYDFHRIPMDKNTFFTTLLSEDPNEVFIRLKEYNFHFDLEKFEHLPLYESVEYLLRVFKLTTEPDAYILYFLEEVFNFSKKKTNLIDDFLNHWEAKKESLSIIVPENRQAVQIMTIHKSKGLEFPVVIYPYDLAIYEKKRDMVWFPIIEKDEFNNFEHLLVNHSKQLAESGAVGAQLYQDIMKEQEFDNVNLMYVALTRAMEQLYIVVENKKSAEDLISSSQYFQNYLISHGRWEGGMNEFSFGKVIRKSTPNKAPINVEYLSTLTSTDWESHNIVVAAQNAWLENLNDGAIHFGLLMHEMLSEIFIPEDIDKVIKKYELKGRIPSDHLVKLTESLNKLVNHPRLSAYFEPNLKVLNEREILTEKGQIIIPDRLICYEDKSAVIIDYKTGNREKSHTAQIQKYANYIGELGFSIRKCLLVYINENIEILPVE